MVPRTFAPWLGFARFLVERFDEDRCMQAAAGLTYTTLLALVPLLTITLTAFTAFPVFSGLMVEVKIFLLTTLVPDSAGKVITVYMEQFSEKAARLTLVGLLFLGGTAVALMLTVERVLNTIWRVRRPRPLVQRFLFHWALLTLGPLFIGGSLSVTSYLAGLSFGWVSALPGVGVGLLKLAQVALTVAAFTLLYLMAPNRYVPFRHALAGGALAGVVFEVMKEGFALYVTHFPTYTLIYGAFAAVPLFLLWVYLSWLVVLAGAELVAALPYWREGAWRKPATPGRRLFDALRVLRALMAAQESGTVLTWRRLSERVPAGFAELEDILERLEGMNLVQRVAGGGWVATRSLHEVPLGEVVRGFVVDADWPRDGREAGLVAALDGMLAGDRAVLARPLASVLGEAAS